MSKKEKQELEPKLRFPEFTSMDEWHNYRLEEISDRIIERVGGLELPTLSISAGIGFVSQEQKFSRDISGKQYKNYIHIKKGDFSYNKGNSKKFPQGCIYELLEYEEAAVPNAFISFRFKDSYVSGFYKGYFENNFHGRQLVKYITSGARMDGLLNINPSDFFNIILPTPIKKEEQQKIADCLSSIDDLISAEEKKLLLLNDYKKGWPQKLFPAEVKTVPEWRFPEFQDSEEWAQKKLDEIGKFIRGFSYSSQDTTDDETKLLVIRSNNIVPMGKTDYINNLRYVNKKCSKEQNLIFGDVTICMANGSSNLIGKSSFYDGGYAGDITVGAFCGIFRSPLPIVRYLFQTNQYNRELQRVSQGGDGAIANLKEIDIKNIEFLLPTLPEEQQKIANFLSGIDDLIGRQTDKIEALKEHKKALMQGLFPSIEEVL